MLDDQLTKCTLDTPAAVGVLRWWADAMWKHRIAPLPEEKTTAGNLPGNIGMWVMWPHATPARREKNANFDWDIQVLPAGSKGHGSVNMDFPYMVPAQPAAPAETWAFIKHMTDKEALERNAREALLLPARKSATQAFYTPAKPPPTNAPSRTPSRAPQLGHLPHSHRRRPEHHLQHGLQQGHYRPGRVGQASRRPRQARHGRKARRLPCPARAKVRRRACAGLAAFGFPRGDHPMGLS